MSMPRRLLVLAAAAVCAACQTPERTTTVVEAGLTRDAPELDRDEATRLIRRTEKNVKQHRELIYQGRTQQAQALRSTIARAVDANFADFEEKARDSDLSVVRNMAVKCLGFASDKRADARDLLLELCGDDEIFIVANAVLGLGTLRDRDTDLTPIIRLCGSGDANIRANAATALMKLFRVKTTPRELTAQHHAAIERLSFILHEKGNRRGRRAAAFAFANLQHPTVLDHLISALADDDEQVQIGGLHGIEKLGDQRAIEPVLEYLETGPTSAASSYATRALTAIAVQAGLTNDPGSLEALEDNPRRWRKWFRAARNK